MKIKKIEITNLLGNPKNKKSWNVNNSLFLYGQNGIGKTTMLDSLYAAITNDFQIFNVKENGSQTTRPTEYDKLTITFDNEDENNVIELNGSRSVKGAKTLQKDIFSYIKNEKLVQIVPEYKNLYNQYNALIQQILLEPKLLAMKDDEKWEHIFDISPQNYHTKGLANPGQILNLMTSLVSSITNIKNQISVKSRAKFMDSIDVLYLTIERMKPREAGYVKSEDFYYAGRKSVITPTISKILDELNEQLSTFNYSLYSFMSGALATLIRNVINTNSVLGGVSKPNVDFAKTENAQVLDFALKNLGFNENEAAMIKKKIGLDDTIDTLINEIFSVKNKNVIKLISKVNNFIQTANTFFDNNGKKIVWNSSTLRLMVEDENVVNATEINKYIFSSGEKQIITILFNLYFHTKEELLILIDEPELSLAIDWQEKLYDVIKSFKNAQVIAVTHSPFVVSEEDYPTVLQRF